MHHDPDAGKLLEMTPEEKKRLDEECYKQLRKEMEAKKKKKEKRGIQNPVLKWFVMKLDKKLGDGIHKLEERNEEAKFTRTTGNDEFFSICCTIS